MADLHTLGRDVKDIVEGSSMTETVLAAAAVQAERHRAVRFILDGQDGTMWHDVRIQEEVVQVTDFFGTSGVDQRAQDGLLECRSAALHGRHSESGSGFFRVNGH